ncbi:hypothetical protein EJF18_10555 [Clavispora lusitaniae]|uniref:Uncharacterized protein n=1 Tax=Clavispora lusitaniae TaxID=36911 RepID=A0ACD0WDQ6_CLALS|nr:hypothetical protein EJF14_10555 [Clavispora lusitaniae]QFZ31237.1 hypothetical protein EJF16_10555 [Clavispora lusitaniae]QFZ36905.1 hypothetical protein EJF15_10555 [Clavispora lusitaniae]QFZ42589.1 hypothetical protein EJF18_10555 [Clavispora lusitaniae]QFZ48265.1 hypothetical protein EJF17_10555 [Clavispora lusitaniae]
MSLRRFYRIIPRQRSHTVGRRFLSDKQNGGFKFANNLDSIDPSIHTMEKILSILHTAESTTVQNAAPEKKVADTLTPEEFHQRFYSSLGSNVVEYQVTRMLSRLEIVNYYKVFQEVDPETTQSIFSRYASIFKDRYMWQIDPSENAMTELGLQFAENPSRTLSALDSKFHHMSKSLLTNFSELRKNDRVEFDFGPVELYQPFRSSTEDPLILRKGLSMKRHPLNLLAVMINDKKVLCEFLSRSRSEISPDLLLNFMTIQGIEGAQAFKILVKRILKDMDPEQTIRSPFESYHVANVSTESDSDIEIVKAIVASRSKLMERLLPYRDYKFGLSKLDDDKQDSNEKVVKILASLFDRYFGVCYRLDAKYCNEWVQNLVNFYLENDRNEALFEQLFKDSIINFQTNIASSKLEKMTFHWGKRSTATNNRGNELKTKELINETRALLARSKQPRAEVSSL